MISISGNFDEVINSIKARKKRIEGKFDQYLERLGQEGIETAKVKMGRIQYDGTVDLFTFYEREENRLYVAVHGESVTFIEFGTGVHYSEQHPLASKLGMIRGAYGLGLGSRDYWHYVGSPGTHGKVVEVSKRGDQVIRTHGNPPNRIVYDTAKELREKVISIAKEVYSDD